MSKYDDIINLERPVSKRKKMPSDMRAAQFAPFSALTGYSEAIEETARIVDKKQELSDSLKETINEKLNYIKKNLKFCGDIKITYFVKDNKKSGGKYINTFGKVKKIDDEYIYMTDGIIISFDDIRDISSDLFNYFDM